MNLSRRHSSRLARALDCFAGLKAYQLEHSLPSMAMLEKRFTHAGLSFLDIALT
ncbi:MAG: hypothetical protein ACU85E_06555 [Gammaproteobacteria bacterium]